MRYLDIYKQMGLDDTNDVFTYFIDTLGIQIGLLNSM